MPNVKLFVNETHYPTVKEPLGRDHGSRHYIAMK